VLRLWNYRSSRKREELTANLAANDAAANDDIEFSLARYEPMAHLLSDEDFLFLKTQPGFRPEIGRKFRRERRRIFRLYLEELARDFHRLHARARVLVASLPAEHSAMVGILFRSEVRFWCEIAKLEAQLTFSWAGVPVDARALVEGLGAMQAQVNAMSAPSAA
jgi:hypothetical protein